MGKKESFVLIVSRPGTQTVISIVHQHNQKRKKETIKNTDINWLPLSKIQLKLKLILMDVDSTAIQQETLDEVAKTFGVEEKVAKITERAMRGELDFKDALMERMSCLKGITEADFMRVVDQLTPQEGLPTLMSWAKAQDIKVALISGGFTIIVQELAKKFGADFYHANTYDFSSGKLIGNIVDGKEKEQYLLNLCSQLKITPLETLVIGDGANDLKMLQQAGLSIGFRPKPILEKHVDMILRYSGLDVIPQLFSFGK